MTRRSIVTLVLFLAALSPAAAQSESSPLGGPSVATLPASRRPHLTVNPAPLLYRRCVDWYEIQDRPSGRVLFPQMRCWWVRGY